MSNHLGPSVKRVLNRRDFLQGSALAAVGAGLGMSGCRSTEQPGRADTIIDTHTHFYDPSRPQGVPWPPKDDRLLYRTVLPQHYKALPKPRPVTATVVVEASSWVEDNQWILDLAERDRFIVGLVGNLPVGAAEFPDLLRRFAANQLVRGLRIPGSRIDEIVSSQPLLSHLRSLALNGLALDLVGGPEMLPRVAKLAGALPELRLMIDHLAGVRVDGKPPEAAWQRGMEEAAQQPRVYCKVSGLVEGTGRRDGSAPGDAAFYAPVLEVAWNTFGVGRLVYGSNWPVSERFAPLSAVQRIVDDFFGAKGEDSREKVFWRNALAFYQWVWRGT
jgi:predicted TIM-barrel fold metal-dependent hydrolase